MKETPISVVTSNNDAFTLEKIDNQSYIRRQGVSKLIISNHLTLNLFCKGILGFSGSKSRIIINYIVLQGAHVL